MPTSSDWPLVEARVLPAGVVEKPMPVHGAETPLVRSLQHVFRECPSHKRFCQRLIDSPREGSVTTARQSREFTPRSAGACEIR